MLVAGLAAALVTAAPAAAQSPAPPAAQDQPAPDALAAARELVKTAKLADAFKAVMPAIMRNLKPVIVQNRADVDRDYETLMPVLLSGMEARLDQMLDAVAMIYARNFTAAELNEIVVFYRSPTGQKFVAKQATIMQESMATGQRWGQMVAAELKDHMVEELRKKGHNIGDPAAAPTAR
jgi:hypothetical protein